MRVKNILRILIFSILTIIPYCIVAQSDAYFRTDYDMLNRDGSMGFSFDNFDDGSGGFGFGHFNDNLNGIGFGGFSLNEGGIGFSDFSDDDGGLGFGDFDFSGDDVPLEGGTLLLCTLAAAYLGTRNGRRKRDLGTRDRSSGILRPCDLQTFKLNRKINQ